MTINKDGNIVSGVRYFNTIQLLSGTSVNNIVTTVGTTGADTSIPTEQAVREAITASGGIGDMWKYNEQSISVDKTLDADKNYFAAGPITITSGTTITISTGSVWTII
jgi:hypothetical protein